MGARTEINLFPSVTPPLYCTRRLIYCAIPGRAKFCVLLRQPLAAPLSRLLALRVPGSSLAELCGRQAHTVRHEGYSKSSRPEHTKTDGALFKGLTRGTQNFHKSTGHLQIVGAIRVTRSKFHTENPQMLGVTVQNLVARATWRP